MRVKKWHSKGKCIHVYVYSVSNTTTVEAKEVEERSGTRDQREEEDEADSYLHNFGTQLAASLSRSRDTWALDARPVTTPSSCLALDPLHCSCCSPAASSGQPDKVT